MKNDEKFVKKQTNKQKTKQKQTNKKTITKKRKKNTFPVILKNLWLLRK